MLIKDEFLRAAIARTLQLKEEEIDEKAMERLVSLSARSAGIISLEGLDTAVNLQYLDLCGNSIAMGCVAFILSYSCGIGFQKMISKILK